MKSKIIKIIIRGNIQNLKYSIHSLIFASKNTICNKEGKIIFSQNMNFIFLNPNKNIIKFFSINKIIIKK